MRTKYPHCFIASNFTAFAARELRKEKLVAMPHIRQKDHRGALTIRYLTLRQHVSVHI